MATDTREDAGQFYPGGQVVPVRPITPGGGGTIVLDDDVTQHSGNGVKSSGIWSFVHGLIDSISVAWGNITGKPAWITPSSEGTTGQVLTKTQTGSTWSNPTGGPVAWNDVTGKPDTFPPSSHTHTPAEAGADPAGSAATAKSEAIAASDPVGSAINAINAHVNTADPHPGKYDASGAAAAAVGTHESSASAHSSLFDGKVSVSGDEMTGALTFKRLAVDGAKIDVGTGNTWPSLYLRGRIGSAKYYSNMIVINDTIQVGLPSSSGDLAITDDIPEVVAPSTSSTDAGKAADAKGTGDALASKVGSFSAVGGQTPTVSGGVADLSSLFSSDNTSLASTIQTKIDETVGTINTALDAINGEVA